MKAQGIRLGPAHYGYELGQQLDERGRRVLVPVESEQAVIAKMKALRESGLSFSDVARRPNEEQVPARRGGTWRVNGVLNFLCRATRKRDRMWRLMSLRRWGDVLLGVVRWVHPDSTAKSFSLAEVSLTEIAVCWRDFASAEAARAEMERLHA